MTDSDLISRHIAERGVTVCPPVYLVASSQATQRGTLIPETETHGWQRKFRISAFAKSRHAAAERKAAMRAEYLRDPTPENIKAMATRRGVAPDAIRKYLRQTGVQIGPRVGCHHGYAEALPGKIAEAKRLYAAGVTRKRIRQIVGCGSEFIKRVLG